MEFEVWEHDGPITCLALDFNRMYSGSWDMSIRVWDRSFLECLNVLIHSDWVWNLAPHDTTVASTAGSDLYVWDTSNGPKLVIINNAHACYTYSLARSHTGKLLFTGGEDGAIHMFEIIGNARCHVRRIATWNPHSSDVYSLAFEFPQAMEIEQRVRALKGLRLENRMRRRNGKGRRGDQCSFEEKKNQTDGDRNNWHNKRRMIWKVKA
ncbi:hypothetical protein K7X08_003739 [Anisodus acutangulus]|uniref:Uncharacterized protein n=1 Tax=Anisodus acutangulus TaxID=402998 RepID=A0A9Q1RJY6_9SOLA|nr:hypothetical protein K7X08_003739 [Anisodus acutangulus]